MEEGGRARWRAENGRYAVAGAAGRWDGRAEHCGGATEAAGAHTETRDGEDAAAQGGTARRRGGQGEQALARRAMYTRGNTRNEQKGKDQGYMYMCIYMLRNGQAVLGKRALPPRAFRLP